MLCKLSIKNFAIIDDLKISFSPGLTVLSGETGAGKSIIIDAVNLLLGARATSGLIRTGTNEAEIEALFEIKAQSHVIKIMESYGYLESEQLLIKRVISRTGRHKIYINDRHCTLNILSLITENMASISGQHAHQGLLKDDQHLFILDQYGDLIPLRKKISEYFYRILPIIKRLKEFKKIDDLALERTEFLKFQRAEIVEASIAMNEDKVLEQEIKRLKNSDNLYRLVNSCNDELYNVEGAIIERLGIVRKNIKDASAIDTDLLEKGKNIEKVMFQVEDIMRDLDTYLKTIQTDSSRLQDIETRFDTILKLKRKYGGSFESVISYLESIDKELLKIENISDKIQETQKDLSDMHMKLFELCKELSLKRREAAEGLAEDVKKELEALQMPKPKFNVSLKTIPANKDLSPYLTGDGCAITETGIDHGIFIISTNIGEDEKPISEIASGGELSRVVLALKAISAKKDSAELIVFDEVDAGIGGGTAEVLGERLASLSDYHQIICITHLPQIAIFGDHHFHISKHVSEGRTRTVIEPLTKKGRIREIARMLGGVKITDATLAHAREMLGFHT
jgi:DNA repair protein RecN (Recombination protein N)